jgi:hypothetical protein
MPRSGYVAANSVAIGPPSDTPSTTERSELPARIDLAACHDGQFSTWVDPTLEGARYLEPGQRDLL